MTTKEIEKLSLLDEAIIKTENFDEFKAMVEHFDKSIKTMTCNTSAFSVLCDCPVPEYQIEGSRTVYLLGQESLDRVREGKRLILGQFPEDFFEKEIYDEFVEKTNIMLLLNENQEKYLIARIGMAPLTKEIGASCLYMNSNGKSVFRATALAEAMYINNKVLGFVYREDDFGVKKIFAIASVKNQPTKLVDTVCGTVAEILKSYPKAKFNGSVQNHETKAFVNFGEGTIGTEKYTYGIEVFDSAVGYESLYAYVFLKVGDSIVHFDKCLLKHRFKKDGPADDIKDFIASVKKLEVDKNVAPFVKRINSLSKTKKARSENDYIAMFGKLYADLPKKWLESLAKEINKTLGDETSDFDIAIQMLKFPGILAANNIDIYEQREVMEQTANLAAIF